MSFSIKDLAGTDDQTPKAQPATPASTPQAAAPQAAATPTSAPGKSSFSVAELGGTPDQQVTPQPTAADIQAQKDQAAADKKAADAKHGILHRAWDWVNSPIGDNVLPDGMKTADIIKAAAFEKMYGQAYIPGINDFDSKAEEHFTPEKATMGKKTEANGQSHPFVASPETHAIRNGIKTFIAGAAKDTSDMAASFTSPLALGTLSLGELGKVPGAVGKIAKTVSPLVGTAFGLQGAGQTAMGLYHTAQTGVTPENVQETLSGAGQAVLGATAPLHTAGDLYRSAESRVRPVTKTIAGQDVPVRPTGALPEAVAKSVDPSIVQAGADKTAAAVQHGVGEVTKGAVGSDATTDVGDRDRFGIRAHAEDLKQKAVPSFKELDRLSEGVFSDAQQDEKNSRLDFSTEGREKFQNARAMQNYIMEEHRDALGKAGHDVDEMKDNYRKQSALNGIADKLDTATNAREGGGYKVNGAKMANVIDSLRREPAADNLFDKAGLSKTHVDALGDLADTLRNEQKIPKVGTFPKLMAKGMAIALSGGHGITGLAEALAGESMAEKLGSKLMTRMFGEAMQSEPVARQLNQAIKSGNPGKLAGWDKFKQVATDLWKSERGEAGLLGTVNSSDADTASESADRFNQERGRAQVSPVTPEAHPQGQRIADAYDAMKHDPSDPDVKASYDALKEGVEDQWNHATQSGFKMEPWTGEGQPYANSKEMKADVDNNKHLYFFRGGDIPAGHPLAEVDPQSGLTYNDKLRAVHDLYGHAAGGYEFGPKGEEAAYKTHAQMFSPEAIPALTSETRGQNNWVNNGPHMRDAEGNMLKKGDNRYLAAKDRPFAEQKAGILPAEFQGSGMRTVEDLKQRYGTTSDVHKAGFILPEGDMIPLVGEHDHMLGGKTTENTREQFIKDSGAIRTRYRMSKAGEEQVFSLPSEITEGQARQIRYAAASLKNGNIVLETVDGKNHQSLEFPTASKAQKALEGLVKIKPDAVEGVTGSNQHGEGMEYRNDNSGSTNLQHTVTTTDAEGNKIGELAAQDTAPKEVTVRSNQVYDPAMRGSGRGPDQLRHLLSSVSDDTNRVKSDISTTGAARGAWDKLQKDNPEAVTKKEYPGGQVQYSVDMDKWRSGPDLESKEITTRRPTSVKGSTENNPDQHANMDAVNQAGKNSPSRTTQSGSPVMGYKEKLARTVSTAPYTGVEYTPEELADPDKVISKFVNHAADNLEWLYNQVPEEIRQQTRKWYDSAHEVTKNFAKQYGLSHEQAAGITAALSPQNPWDNNVGLAKRMMDINKNRQNFDFSPDMEKKAADLKKVPTQSKAFKGLLKDIDGKKLKDVVNADPDVQAAQRALWIRLYDEAHGSPVNDQYAPTGEVTGHSPDTRSWIGLDHAAKAVKIMENGSVNNINDVMGQGHKIRNFYNNLINPNSQNGHVTIDTHATAAAQMQPFGAKDTEAAHNFGGTTPGIPGPPKDAATGLGGTYPLYAEAYQRVAKKFGILPRELQSVVWEAIKSLMGDEKKTPELKARVKELWQTVQEGGLTPEEARARIKDEAQGFSKPVWMSDAEWDRISEDSGDTSFNPEGGK